MIYHITANRFPDRLRRIVWLEDGNVVLWRDSQVQDYGEPCQVLIHPTVLRKPQVWGEVLWNVEVEA